MEAKVLVDSFGLDCISFVKIDYSPSLISSILVAIDNNFLAFLILCSIDWEGFTILPIDELVVLVLKHLEPSRVSWPDLHVVGSTSALDIPWLIVQSSSDRKRLLMEVPYLSLSSILNLNDHVSVVD
jgi:hypothetical protein